MKSPKPPPAPDPVKTAAAQGGANRDTAISQGLMNMTNQVGPNGSLTYDKIGDEQLVDSLTGQPYSVPRYQATTRLSPEQERINSINTATEENIAQIGRDQSGRIGSLLGQPINFDGVRAVKEGTYQNIGTNDFSEDRMRVENALMDRLNPQISRDRSSLEARLINQGLRPGSAAYNDAASELGRNANDARLGAILNAGTEQSRLADLERNTVGFNNNNEARRVTDSLSARQQGIQEILTLRNQPINEITALMNGSQVTMPQFVNTPQTQLAGTDYQGAVYQSYQGQMDAYKQKVASNNAMMGGLFGLAGTVGKAAISDRRLKRDIKTVGALPNGLPVYTFRYLWSDDMHTGLMSDDVRKVHPDAVLTMANGFEAVDYAKAVL